MAKNLVIVESPAKAGTIAKYLGPDYQVLASFGHVRDLPTSKLGVEVEKAFQPSYLIPQKARKVVKTLKEALKNKERLLLATDLDREGEAIAWHITEALEVSKLKKLKVERITFDEITRTAIQKAVEHPHALNLQLIDAQQARRVLDRLVGYTLSPLLWKKIYKGLSAGRVQSVALRLIVERERERQNFKPVEYWSLQALLHPLKEPTVFTANLTHIDGKKLENYDLHSQTEVEQIITNLEQATYQVEKIETKQSKRRPLPPYTTSTLQQDGVNKLNMSAKRVMQQAQRLYEAGLITYMRTDSVALASEAVSSIRHYVGKEFGDRYLPAKPHFYQNKSKNAQEAHEAIRPTDPSISNAGSDTVQQKVYELIRRRTLASQMAEAELEQTAVDIQAAAATFRANGQRILFPGFLAVWGKEEKEDNLLPKLKEKETLELQELKPEQHFTEPPPRYSEATLIKTLEEQGIGRPSTYAPTIDTLIQRRYVTLEQRRFAPEEVGYLVTDLLVKHFPEIVDLGFTARMEDKLDDIALGKTDYFTTLKEFWQPFQTQVQENTEKIEKVDTTEKTDQLCPNCGAPMLIKMGRFGKFLACSRFPECKTTKPLQEKAPTGLICPICGKPLVEKRARRSSFLGCSGYPNCTFAIWKRDQLEKKILELEKKGVALPHKQESLAQSV